MVHPAALLLSIQRSMVAPSLFASRSRQCFLGCANPLVFAGLMEGETVLDLGSGGYRCAGGLPHVGKKGKVYGLDMTEEMLELANQNKKLMGATNVEFLKGFIEEIPLPDDAVDVVISNCVINLSMNKEKVFREIFRILKPGGRLAIADILALKEVPENIRKMTEMWVSCIAGALYIDTCKRFCPGRLSENRNTAVHYYTKEVLESMAGDKARIVDLEWEIIDGAFAGSYIKAASNLEKPILYLDKGMVFFYYLNVYIVI